MEDGLETTYPGSVELEQQETRHQETVYDEVDDEDCRFARHTPLPGHPLPLRRVQQGFWTAGVKEIPCFSCSPWDFYEPFLDIGALGLVACNKRSTVRALKVFSTASWVRSATFIPLLQILHQNFVDVYEVYYFEREVFVITEHVGLSLEHLLQKSVCLSEPDIAYIIGEVSRTLSLFSPCHSDVLDFGRHMLHLVEGYEPSQYIHSKRSCVSKR
jgi:hypothetical protein